MTGEQSLDSWVRENQDEITQLQAFSVADLPDEPAALAQDLSRAARDGARAGFLLMDAEAFVLKAHAAAVMEVRRTHDDMTAEERRVMAKADPTYLQVLKLRDSLAVIVAALKTRCFVSMNSRRSTFIHPSAQES